MSKKSLCLISLVLMLALAGNTSAMNFTDAGADHLWNNPQNWSDGVVPDANADDGSQYAKMTTDGTICIIDETHVGVNAAQAKGGYTGALGGDNEWYMTGGELKLLILNVGRGRSDTGSVGYFKITDGLILTRGFGVPNQFVISGGSTPRTYGQMIRGHADLHGGDIHITGAFFIGSHLPDEAKGGIGSVDITADCTIYWYGGDAGDPCEIPPTTPPTGRLNDVNDWVNNGWFTAYDDKGYVTRRLTMSLPEAPWDPNNVLTTIISGILTWPQPRNGKMRVELDSELRWDDDPEPEDPNSYDVWFCASGDANNLALVSSGQSETYYVPPGTMTIATDHCWQIVRYPGPVSGPVWTFSTLEPKATLVYPEDEEEDVEPSAIIEWTAGPQVDFHDVYLDPNYALVEANDISTYKDRQTETTYDPDPDMDWGTTYYLRIDEVADSIVYPGDVWSFDTWPLKARLVNPTPDGVINVPRDVVLEWIPVPNGTAGVEFSKLYFSTTQNQVNNRDPEADQGIQAGTTFDPEPDLDYGTTYHWCVDANSYSGDPNYPGDLWSFTTHVLTCEMGTAEGDTNGDCIVDVNDLKTMTDNWLECGFESQFCP